MSYTSSPPEQTYPARASRLHRSADKHEAEAERKRREANELDRKWAEYIAKRDAAKEQTVTASPLPNDVVAEFLARCRTEWAEAGLPAHVTDAAVLDQVAAIVANGQHPVPNK